MGYLDLGDGSRGHMGSIMPRKKLKSAGPMPVDLISDQNRAEPKRQRGRRGSPGSLSSGGPTRYTGLRYSGARELLTRGSSVNGAGAAQKQIDDMAQELKQIGGHSAADKDGEGSSGIVSLLDNGVGSQPVVVKYSINGDLRTLDVYGQTNHESQAVMHFITDSTGPRVQFTLDRMENKETQIDICRDCARVLVDESFTSIGFILLTARRMRLDTRFKASSGQHAEADLPTTVLQFMSKDSSKIKMVQATLKTLKKCKVRVLPTLQALMEELRALGPIEQEPVQDTFADSTKEVKSKFPHKERFRSIERRRTGPPARSSSESALKIVVPSSPERLNVPRVPTGDFYSRKSGLQKHAFSNQDSVRQTRSKTPVLSQSKLWNLDDEAEHETPEKFEPELCYKFDDGASYTITNQDFKCLYNHDWINDTILDFFTKYYVEQAVRESIVSKEEVCIMSSFFYTKLISDPTDYYRNIKKWVCNSNLFQKKYIVVPININFHWFGCIITNLDSLMAFFQGLDDTEKAQLSSRVSSTNAVTKSTKLLKDSRTNDVISRLSSRNNTPSTTEEDDDEISVSAPIIRILTFDSLRQTHTREIDPLKEFLIAYAKDKYSIDLDKSLIKMKTCAVPQQPNMSDCGVHVILNTMKFFQNPRETIEVWRSTKSRSKVVTKVVNEYFEKNKRNSARKDLRDILWGLQKKQIEQMEGSEKSIDNKPEPPNEEEDGDLEIIEELTKHVDGQVVKNGSSEDKLDEHSSDQLKQTSSPEGEQVPVEGATSEANSQSALPREVIQHKELTNEPNLGDHVTSLSSVRTSSVVPFFQRRYLESSPVQSSNEHVLPGISSPYFRNTLSRGGKAVGDKERYRRLIASPSSDKLDDLQAKRENLRSPSPRLLERSAIDEDDSSSAMIEMRGRDSRSSLSSVGNDGMISLSDSLHDDDVNLVGRDTLIQVQRKLNSELNGRSSDESIHVSRSSSHTPILARDSVRTHRLKEQWPNGSDSDLIDELSTAHQIEMITSD